MNLRSRSSTTNDRKRAVRLSVESLESRRLLAGLQVSVFIDNDGSRTYEPSIESPAVDRLVYVDLNESGGFDPGEPVAVTDLQGLATFDGLNGDDYSVGLISNPQSQLQTSPVRLAEQAAVIGPGSESLLASTDLSRVWNVDGQGVATQYSADGSSSLSVDLGGPLVSSTRSTSESIWLVIDGETGPLLKSFDPSTGEILEFDYPLAEHQGQITEIVATSAGIVGLIETLSGSRFLARFQDSLDGLDVAELSTTDATSIAGASQSSFVVVSAPQTTGSRIDLLDANAGLTPVNSIPVVGQVTSIELADDATHLFVATGESVQAIERNENTLQLAAVFADARSPIAYSSADKRLYTSSKEEIGNILSWDARTWLPGSSVSFGGNPPQALVLDQFGNQALVLTAVDTQRIDLAQAVTTRAKVGEETAQIGVRTTGQNRAPNGTLPDFATAEDVERRVELPLADVNDADGDQLVFKLADGPAHGVATIDDFGILSYLPAANYYGNDEIVVAVFDGLTSTEIAVQVEVTPVNDLPDSIHVQLETLPEDSNQDELVGFVTIADADPDAEYHITTSDERFEVVSGAIYYRDGNLDHESEPTVSLEITAVDVTDSGISISTEAEVTVADIDEPATTVRLSSLDIAENESGAVIGLLSVDDPEGSQDYEFSVDNDQFMIDGQQLRLADGVSLNYEAANSEDLNITATKSGDNGQTLSKAFRLQVLDRNDPPTGIEINRIEVEEDTAGAAVGEVTVLDEDANDPYEFSVSDSRFEFVGSTLKLKDSEVLPAGESEELFLAVTASSVKNGVSTSKNLALKVVKAKSPHQNPKRPNDVNDDGKVTPLDALILINEINKNGSRVLPSDGGSAGAGEPPRPFFPDANGDGILSPADVMRVINEMNGGAREGEGEGQFEGLDNKSTQPSFLTDVIDDFNELQRKRRNAEIDAELERLLDQLANDRPT